jgi:ankyrin repeat protein
MCEVEENGKMSPIHIAAIFGSAEIVQNLLDCGAITLDKSGYETALHLAAMKGHDEVCNILLKHDKILTRTLWERMTGPSLQVDSKLYNGKTPFVYAVEKNHARAVEVFLRHYPELVKATDGNRWLLFHRSIELEQIDMVRIFLRHGVDVEMRNSYGNGALHLAVRKEDTELIQLILDHGAVINAKDKSGLTPEDMTRDPKIRMILRNHARAQSKSTLPAVAPVSSPPPPEYKARYGREKEGVCVWMMQSRTKENEEAMSNHVLSISYEPYHIPNTFLCNPSNIYKSFQTTTNYCLKLSPIPIK